ncbi:MAG: hypothetical protein NT062_36755 [Proteobacteria bacterium]|nr:hypothetical protein [Pseudomonadota bacterium]
MAKLPSVPEATYGALERIRGVVLVDFSSLFSPDRSIWTGPNLETLHQLFVQRFDKGEGDFFAKFREQLDGADDDGLQLAAELLYVQQFFTSLTGPEKKLQNVRRVLGWMSRAVELPRWAVDGLALGLSSDQSFNQHRPYHLAWLIEFLLAWHAEVDQAALVADPARFRSFAMGVEGTQGAHQPMREAWFHMVLPDDFEPMSSRADKRAILASFRSELGHDPSESIDADLADIRRALEPRFGSGFNYCGTKFPRVDVLILAKQQDDERPVHRLHSFDDELRFITFKWRLSVHNGAGRVGSLCLIEDKDAFLLRRLR